MVEGSPRRRPTRLSALAVAAAAGLLAVVPACGGGDDGADPADGAGAGGSPVLTGSLQRSTLFDTHRALALTVRPRGDADLHLGSIQLATPLFEAVPAEERDALIRATDRAVVMPLPYGTARCGAGVAADGPAQLVTDVDGEDLRIPLDETPGEVLADLHAAECAQAAALDDVELRLGDDWVRTGPRTIEGRFDVVQRHAGVTAAVEELSGNVIFTTSTAGGDPWLAVSDERPTAGGAVTLTASRCDPHALIEYKRTFVLSAWVRVGDREPAHVDVRAEGPTHRAMEELLAACIG